MNSVYGKWCSKAAMAGAMAAALAGGAAHASDRAQLTVRGYVPVNCKLDFPSFQIQSAASGRVELGAIREFCNTHNYRIMVDFDPVLLSGSHVSLGGDVVELGNAGTDLITQGHEPTVRTRPIAVTLNRQLQAVATITLRIEASI